jgi:hypothetical protein
MVKQKKNKKKNLIVNNNLSFNIKKKYCSKIFENKLQNEQQENEQQENAQQEKKQQLLSNKQKKKQE